MEKFKKKILYQRREDRRAAEHERDLREKAAEHERFKDRWLCLSSTFGLVATSLICLVALLVGGEAAQRWAVPMLTLIVGGCVGYQKGATSGKTPEP